MSVWFCRLRRFLIVFVGFNFNAFFNTAETNPEVIDYSYYFSITPQTEHFQFGELGQILNLGDESLVLRFDREEGECPNYNY
jgi:hypothetical protein